MIDFHSHVLPGIDDGSASLEESIELLKIEAEHGVTHVVATPHFYPSSDSPEKFLKRRKEAFELLSKEMEKYEGLPSISLGAEVYFFRGISDSEHLLELTIDEKRYILIEMPPPPWDNSMYHELESIYRERGITPIMAHIDRYIRPFNTHKIPERFDELHVLVQANASFFLKGGLMTKLGLKLLKEDKIQLLGSDCHGLKTRPPKLKEAVEVIDKKLGEKILERIDSYGKSVLGI